jgi:hypothetical protein
MTCLPHSGAITGGIVALLAWTSAGVAARADETHRAARSPEISQAPWPSGSTPAACISWDGGWVLHAHSLGDGAWSSWKSPPLADLPKRGGFTKVSAWHAVVVDPLK